MLFLIFESFEFLLFDSVYEKIIRVVVVVVAVIAVRQ